MKEFISKMLDYIKTVNPIIWVIIIAAIIGVFVIKHLIDELKYNIDKKFGDSYFLKKYHKPKSNPPVVVGEYMSKDTPNKLKMRCHIKHGVAFELEFVNGMKKVYRKLFIPATDTEDAFIIDAVGISDKAIYIMSIIPRESEFDAIYANDKANWEVTNFGNGKGKNTTEWIKNPARNNERYINILLDLGLRNVIGNMPIYNVVASNVSLFSVSLPKSTFACSTKEIIPTLNKGYKKIRKSYTVESDKVIKFFDQYINVPREYSTFYTLEEGENYESRRI